jgi:energy-coupling factor transporter ATP-binding protein EcfA2
MDEPTNFLDLESVDALIAACNKYKGALLLVSHNRDFLKKCATTYLSVVPGKFDLFNNLKQAEQSTYTFIADMESGIKVSKDALQKNPGGGTVHHSQVKAGEQKTEEKDGAKAVIGATAVKAAPAAVKAAAPAAAKAAAPVTYTAGEVCQALWTDGKYYAAKINKVEQGGKYSIVYTAYSEKAIVPAASLKKAVAAAAPAKGAPAKKA